MMHEQYATSKLRFTYYLGAGASFEALPIIDTLPKAFLELSEILEKNSSINSDYKDLKNFYIEKLKIMSEMSINFGTIDTYLKFLFLKNKQEFEDIKSVLCFFFLYHQRVIKKRDKRALIFLTSILQYDCIFPPNINFISWNYDFQIELAAEYFKNESISALHGGAVKHETPLVEYYPHCSPFTPSKFQLVHLNGIAGIYEHNKIGRNAYSLRQINEVNDLFKLMHNSNDESLMYFAWQYDSNDTSEQFKHSTSIMENTDVLVIIGYSFPYFNRNIDSALFKTYLNNIKQKKIYFQNPSLDGSFLRGQFNIESDIEIIHIKETLNYYIPKEL